MSEVADRIPEEVLAEQWFRFMHRLIGDLQRAYRQANAQDEITQKKMAARLGKKPSFISRCLSGQQNMTIRTIHDLARSMGFRLELALRPLGEITPSNRSTQLREAAKDVLDRTASSREAELIQLHPRETKTTTAGIPVQVFDNAA